MSRAAAPARCTPRSTACPATCACGYLPDLTFESAAFATLGSIAMHGVRQADVRLGERVAVIGLGLVGQLAAPDPARRRAALSSASTWIEALVGHARGARRRGQRLPAAAAGRPRSAGGSARVRRGASSPRRRGPRIPSNSPLGWPEIAVAWWWWATWAWTCPRGPYYEKELDLRLSRSYGPGRYDKEYEERGLDYPIGYVRWTERRNMAAFLELVASGKVDVSSLITGRVDIEDAAEAYERLATSDASPLAIILPTPRRLTGGACLTGPAARRSLPTRHAAVADGLGVIGAGSFAERVLVPGPRLRGLRTDAIASASGLSADHLAERFGSRAPCPGRAARRTRNIDVVAIATGTASHAELALKALRAGKAVFVEKPPALDFEELDELDAAVVAGPPLVVGFNRRHAPQAVALREHVAQGARAVEPAVSGERRTAA